MIKLLNTHKVHLIEKLVTPGLLVTVAKVKIAPKKKLNSIPTLLMHLLERYFLRRLLKYQYSAINAQNVIQQLKPGTN